MKKIFLKLYQRDFSYGMIEDGQTKNFHIQDLFWYLERNYDWLHLDEIDGKLIVWSDWDFKEVIPYNRHNLSFDDYLEYGRAYNIYRNKHWKEIPKVTMTKQNYEEILQQWKFIQETKPAYLIFTEYDDGRVEIIGKNELSEQDKLDMQREHKIYLNFKRRWKQYLAAHPKRSKIWRSPADDEYESDFAHYDPVDEQGID